MFSGHCTTANCMNPDLVFHARSAAFTAIRKKQRTVRVPQILSNRQCRSDVYKRQGLIAIHGQHDNQSLMDPSTHLSVLDSFAQNQVEHAQYYKVYRQLCKVKKQIDALEMDCLLYTSKREVRIV